MSLTPEEQDACKLLVSQIKSRYLSGGFDTNLGLCSMDLNVPGTKCGDAAAYFRSMGDILIVQGNSSGKHIKIYVVTRKGAIKIDLTGHVMFGSEDLTKKKGSGQAGEAVFNVHVDFKGESEANKKLRLEIAQQQANKPVKKVASPPTKPTSANIYDLLNMDDDG